MMVRGETSHIILTPVIILIHLVTYQDVFPSILARSVGNWTGFGEMPSSAAGEILALIIIFMT
jgi:hypothetical protein